MKKGFTLIELLVVIAILSILAVTVFVVLNPAELLRQGRDSTRLSDLAAVNSSLALFLADVSNVWSNDSANVTATTTNMVVGCPFTITCLVNSSTAVDGTGWVNVNFNLISSGSPLASLPLDPLNGDAKCGSANDKTCFYGFARKGSNTTYELNADMESDRYSRLGSNDVESTDGGNQTDLYEVGSALNL